MKHADGDIQWKDLPQACCIVRYIFPVCALALFYHRTDHVGLSSLPHLALYKGISLWAVGSANYAVLNRKTHGRKLIYNGNIQVSVYNDSKGSGDRGGTHNQYMRRIASGGQGFPLFHTKAVLLIGDHKAQIFVHYFFLDQRVGTNDHICFPGRNFPVNSSFLLLGGRTGEKNRMTGSDPLLFH